MENAWTSWNINIWGCVKTGRFLIHTLRPYRFSSLSFHTSLASSVPNLTVFHLAYLKGRIVLASLIWGTYLFFFGRQSWIQTSFRTSLSWAKCDSFVSSRICACHSCTGLICAVSSSHRVHATSVCADTAQVKRPPVWGCFGDQKAGSSQKRNFIHKHNHKRERERETKLKGILPRK